MKKSDRGIILSGLAVLILTMLFSCSFAPGDVSGDRVIAVSIGGGSSARLLEVDEYEVSSVDIEVFGPGGGLLKAIYWKSNDGPQTYYIQAEDFGDHEIVLTHRGKENGETVTAVESTFFSIVPMLITVIDITPGAIAVINVSGGEIIEPPCDMVGTWVGTVPFPGIEWTDYYVEISFFEDGTATNFTYYSEGGSLHFDSTFRGTYTCDLPTLSGEWTHMYNPELPPLYWELLMNNEADPPVPSPIVYSSEVFFLSPDKNSIEQLVDFGNGLTATWILTRQ